MDLSLRKKIKQRKRGRQVSLLGKDNGNSIY